MEKAFHIILSVLITILFTLTINIAKITGDIVIGNVGVILLGVLFFIFLLLVNILFVIRK